MPLPSQQSQLQQHQEATELFDDNDQGSEPIHQVTLLVGVDDDEEGSEPIHQVMLLGLLAQALDLDLQIVIAHVQEANGGEVGAVPASAAAVAGLEKQTFRANQGCGGITECAVCFEDFEDGEEVSVMPCSGAHAFHSECIAKWLGQYSNMCPLCRHALPTGTEDQKISTASY